MSQSSEQGPGQLGDVHGSSVNIRLMVSAKHAGSYSHSGEWSMQTTAHLSVEMSMTNQTPMKAQSDMSSAMSGEARPSKTSLWVAILNGGGRVGPGTFACPSAC